MTLSCEPKMHVLKQTFSLFLRCYLPITKHRGNMSSWTRILKQTSYEETQNKQSSTKVKLSEGLSFRGLDLQTGLVNPFEVFRTLYHGQAVITFKPNTAFLDFARLQETNILLFVNGEINIEKSIYDPEFPKYPVEVETHLNSFRKSTFILDLLLNMTSGLQAKLSSNIICLSKDTRKPNPLPAWWREKYQSFCEKTNGMYFEQLVCPEVPVCRNVAVQPYVYTVQRREMDWNGHANAVFYLRYCLDALEHHLCMNNLQVDTNTLFLKTANFFHKGDSKTGDKLSIVFWDDHQMAQMVCFEITKSGQSIYQANMQFHDS